MGDEGQTCSRCVQLQCDLQAAEASRDAYTKKLAEKSAEVRELEKGWADRLKAAEAQVATLEEELQRGAVREATLNKSVQEYISEKSEAASEVCTVPTPVVDKLHAELQRREDDLLHLRETIANMQARDMAIVEAAASSDEALDMDKQSQMLSQLQQENIRLVSLVMELKKREADSINDKNERESTRSRTDSCTDRDRSSGGSHREAAQQLNRKAQEGLGVCLEPSLKFVSNPTAWYHTGLARCSHRCPWSLK